MRTVKVTFQGKQGAGKTTLARILMEAAKAEGWRVCYESLTQDAGGRDVVFFEKD